MHHRIANKQTFISDIGIVVVRIIIIFYSQKFSYEIYHQFCLSIEFRTYDICVRAAGKEKLIFEQILYVCICLVSACKHADGNKFE